ncbi:hypothetical protein ACVW0Y_004605 [Pseudomonas sp. TE3786]
MTFAYACARLKEYFYPRGFEAVLATPEAMDVRLFDKKTGEDFAVVAGLSWSATSTEEDLVDIIEAIEEELHVQEFVHVPKAGDSGSDE